MFVYVIQGKFDQLNDDYVRTWAASIVEIKGLHETRAAYDTIFQVPYNI